MTWTHWSEASMKSCKRCGSAAINHHRHGRDGSDPQLCDVCFWRSRAEALQASVDRLRESLGVVSDKLGAAIRTWPTPERSECLRAIDDANRIAFTAWREAAEKAAAT